MAIDDELKAQVEAEMLKRPDVSTRAMMGTTAFMVRARMFAFWMADGIVVKTPRDTHDDLMRSLGGSPFRGPQGGFGEWMTVPVEAERLDDVKRTIDAAYRYVAGSAKVPTRRKKRR